tara:strand:+ start:5517 stop:5798 length:282 start_codon:yes stop_codon:yes gene_type:complete
MSEDEYDDEMLAYGWGVGNSWYDRRDKYLWQAMGKENLDPNNSTTDEEWALFVEHYADAFAENASDMAYALWHSFLDRHPDIKTRYEDDEEDE